MKALIFIIPLICFLVPTIVAGNCVTVEQAKTIYPNGESTLLDKQGVLMLDQKYFKIYAVHLQKGDQALIADEFPKRIKGSVNLVLFKNGCAIGEGRIPKQIFRNMLGGDKA